MTAEIAFEHVSKRFPGVLALDDVSFSLRGGEVRALMGENGAGKSTLLKILSGEHRPDEGTLLIDGAAVRFDGPAQAQAAGIAVIHQELQLVPDLSVTENLLLGRLPTRFGLVDRAEARRQAEEILALLGEDIAPDAKVRSLPIGKRQMVEIGKALARNATVIAFDEPTSSLSMRESESLMRIIDDLRRNGRAILYVSHRMEEVFEVSDGITVLRDGRRVADFLEAEARDSGPIISAMAGRAIEDVYDWRPRPAGPVSVAVEGLIGPGLSAPADLTVRSGEIIGFFGLVGAGRTELFRLLYGAAHRTGGTVRIDDVSLAADDPRDAIRAGVGMCPEDRKDEGILALGSVAENIVIARRNLGMRFVIDDRAEVSEAARQSAAMRVKAPSLAVRISTLSGGNQQKAIIARWLAADAKVLLMDEPTRGIDIGAKSEIYQLIYRLAEAGRTILFASSDMPEVLGIADRIIVMREGAIAGVVPRDEATPERLLRLALPDSRQPPAGAPNQ